MIWLSSGLGVDSTAAAIEMKRRGINFAAIFADTGVKKPSTYDFMRTQFKPWCLSNGIPFVVVRSPLGDLESYSKSCGIMPSRRNRWCTDKFKIQVLHNFAGKGATFAIGIDADEAHRAANFKAIYEQVTFPLLDWDIDRNNCMKIIASEGLTVPEKSGCWFCPQMDVMEVIKLPDCRLAHLQEWEAMVNSPNNLKRKKKNKWDEFDPFYFFGDHPIPYWRNRARSWRENGTMFDDEFDHIQMPCGCFD